MEQLARWTFDVSWQAAILIALVAALRLALGARLTPNWRCALWALVALRLLLPGFVPLPTPSDSVVSPTLSSSIPSPLTITVTKFWDELAPHQRSVVSPSTPGHSAGSGSDQSAAPDSSRAITLLSWIWITGAALMLTRLAATHLRLARRIRRMPPVTDPRTLAAVTETAAEMGVARNVRVVTTAEIRTPAVYGLRRPVLLLPSTSTLPPDDLRLVLLHEMAHLRRRDVHVQWLAGLLTAIHWFNPLVWLAALLCRADRELACDAAVLRHVGPDRRHDYGDCLVRVVESVAPLPPNPAAVGLFGSKRHLRQRIRLIAAYRPTHSPRRWLPGPAAFVAIGCAAITGPRAQTEPAAPPQAAVVAQPPPVSPADAAAHALLDKNLADVSFYDRPFAEVVDYLREMTGANIFVNWRALAAAGIERNAPVSARLRNVRAAKVLDTVLRDVGGGTVRLRYKTDDGVVMISTADDLRDNTVTRVYDIRDLLVEIPDYGPPRTAPSTAAAATRPATGPAEPTRAQRVAQITSLLQEVVDPDSWRDAGGTIGSIRELHGQLIVSQTPENHAFVAQLLDLIREGRAIQIVMESRYVFVDQDTLDRMGPDWTGAQAKNGTAFLTDEKVNAFLRTVQKAKESTIVTSPRVTLFNGQRAWVKVTTLTTYVKDVVVVRTKDGDTRYEPQMGSAEAGLTLDVSGTVSADRKYVTTSVRSVMSALKELKSRPFPGAPAGMQVQTPDLTERTTETTASVPDGQTLLLVAMTPEAADGITRPKGQTFILIKPTVIEHRETAPKTYPIQAIPRK